MPTGNALACDDKHSSHAQTAEAVRGEQRRGRLQGFRR